ncbi:MAG: thioesterase family protein [Pseudomonadota bacterium]
MTAPLFSTPAHIYNVAVAADDIDDYGHANNAAYVKWMNDCAWAHSAALGFDFTAYEQYGCGFVVMRHRIDYLGAAFQGDDLTVATWVIENDGRLRCARAFEITRGPDGARLLLAMTSFACVDLKTGAPKRMPTAYAEGYPVMAPTEEIAAFKARFA